MNQSESIAELAKALNKVQSEHLFALTDKENPFFKSKYADLSSVWSVARDPLIKNGLSVVQTFDVGNNMMPIIVTTLLHTSGEWIRGSLEMPILKADPQAVGSSITYGRRYALSAMLGICPEDDDGDKGMARNDSQPEEYTAPPQTYTDTATPQVDPSQMTKKQANFIMVLGKEFNLEEGEIKEFVRWVADQRGLDPKSKDLVKALLGDGDDPRPVFGDWYEQWVGSRLDNALEDAPL